VWRLRKDALLLLVAIAFYLFFLFSIYQEGGRVNIPLWVHVVCPLVILFLGAMYWNDRKIWQEWKLLIDAYQLQVHQEIGFWDRGKMVLTGELASHTFQIILREIDEEDAIRDYCEIRLDRVCPEKSQWINLEGWESLKAELDQLYGLQRPALDTDPAMPGEDWKTKEFPSAVIERERYNQGAKSKLSWNAERLLIIVEIDLPSASEISNIIDSLEILQRELEDVC